VFWEHVRRGLFPGEAGVAVGVSEGTGRCWFREAGGVKPRSSKSNMLGPRPRLTLAERVEIQAGVHAQESLRSIGRRLGRPASTIKREIDSNCELRNRHTRLQVGVSAQRRLRRSAKRQDRPRAIPGDGGPRPLRRPRSAPQNPQTGRQ
jgi:hypothetical protein